MPSLMSIEERHDFNSLPQLKHNLYVKVFVDPEGYKQASKPENYEFWERTAKNLAAACEKAIVDIYNATGSFPRENEMISKGTDPCRILKIEYIVYSGGEVLAWFDCRQLG